DERVRFLKQLLEFNKYKVVVVPSAPPKVAPAATPAPTEENAQAEPSQPLSQPVTPDTFTIGVTDVTFNPTNAIFGRLLKAPGGRTITLAYWQQNEEEPRDDIPYFDNK